MSKLIDREVSPHMLKKHKPFIGFVFLVNKMLSRFNLQLSSHTNVTNTKKK